MAKVDVKMPEAFLLKVSKLADKTDEIVEKVLEAGGEVVLDKVKSNLRGVVGKDLKDNKPSRATGELVDSLGMTPVDVDRNGVYNLKIGFNEPRRKQYAAKKKRSYHLITNAMIANVLEHGKHGQPAKPFLKPAKRATQKRCRDVMERTLEEEIEKI
ncbi:HK97 gp10 family phage protein [Eubacteriales bacterium OttesenSCG-928-A19]|nr:HK97 gp10 family phage protein [Eubacteriales bacterium OttesenSCG-928-A19]